MQATAPRERWLGQRLPSPDDRRLVVITGARQTGKTTIARDLYRSLRYLNLDDLEIRSQLASLRSASWAKTIGAAVIDEAQKEPSVFEKVKLAYDASDIDFSVLLGSSRILLLRQVRESLAGRAFLYDLWPLMLSELITPKGKPLPRPIFDSLLRAGGRIDDILLEEPEVLLGRELELRKEALEHLLRWGGMPELLSLNDEDRRMWLRSYQQTFLERDLADLARLNDLEPFRGLQQLAMLRTGNLLSFSELARDAKLSTTTVRRYLEYLDLSYQTLQLAPYSTNLTSTVIKSPKLYWCDMGLLRQATLQLGAATGALFESLVVAECHKWVSTMAADAKLYFYRTRSGFEIDLLVATPQGVLGLEIKNRDRATADDARNLAAIAAALGEKWLGGIVVSLDPHLRLLSTGASVWAIPAFRLF
jgi:predicted AAA+ superfamily ATPase